MTNDRNQNSQHARHVRGHGSRRDYRYALIVCAGLAAVLSAGIAGVMLSLRVQTPVRHDADTGNGDIGTGAIFHAADGRCRSFDNATGRTATRNDGCDEIINGKADVRGTAGRINAISKAFNPTK